MRFFFNTINMSCIAGKPVLEVFDKVLHKPGCTTIEDGQRHEILNLGTRGFVNARSAAR